MKTSEQISVDEAEAVLTAFLKSKRMRKTPERFAILRHLWKMEPHFEIDGLYSRLEASGYHVSRATVYSSVKLLSDCGLVRRHAFGDGHSRYEKARGCHTHLVCSDCGRIQEIASEGLTGITPGKKISGFMPDYFSLTVYGRCRSCLSRQAKSRHQRATTADSGAKRGNRMADRLKKQDNQ